MEEAKAERPGGQGISLRLSELMFVELLRRYIGAPGPKPPGWLSAFSDPALARVLAAIHAAPGEDWTLEALSSEARLSRSALAERFAERVGHSPLRYLTMWRMQLAGKMLTEGTLPVAEIGRRFKQTVGVSPSEWRRSISG